jgi:hypothetical protein
MILKNAHLQDHVTDSRVDPANSGWSMSDGNFNIVWFVGDQMPKDIEGNMSAVDSTPTDNDDVEEYSCSYYSDESDYEIEDDMV